MNFKKQAIVAAAILAVAGAANANLQIATSGVKDSSLAFVALDTTAKQSFVVDLGTTFSQFLPQGMPSIVPLAGDGTPVGGFSNTASAITYTPGTSLTWNFATNTFTKNGVVQTAALNGKTIDWSAFSQFTANSTAKWGVVAAQMGVYNLDPALDPGFGGIDAAHLIATAPAGATALATRIGAAITGINGVMASNGAVGINADVTKAGSTFSTDTGLGYVAKASNLGTAGNADGALPFSVLAANGATRDMIYTSEVPNSPDGAGDTPFIVTFAGQWNYTGSTLSYTVPGAVTPSVPEAESFALALAGLAAIAFAARRRQA